MCSPTGVSNLAIRDAALRWAKRQPDEVPFGKLQPPQFRQAIQDVAAELKVPRGVVLDELMQLWSELNDKGRGKESLTGGGAYLGTGGGRDVGSSVTGARIEALTSRRSARAIRLSQRTDLVALLSPSEQRIAEKSIQGHRRSGFEGLSATDLRQVIADLEPLLDKTRGPAAVNELLDVPVGAQLRLLSDKEVPATMREQFDIVTPHLASNTPEGLAKELAAFFEKSGRPQVTRVNGTLMIVDSHRPDAQTALADWKERLFAPEVHRDLAHALLAARAKLDDLGGP
jgi:hypothetical protein